VIARWAVPLLLGALLAGADEDGPDIHLFPLVENTRNEAGGRTASALLLWHRSTDASGAVRSTHVLNWLSTPDLQAVVPLWFQGPDWTVVPPLLSASWRDEHGGKALWLTPLFHRYTRADGSLESLHYLNWIQSDNFTGLLPIGFGGRDWWMAPPLLSGGWTRRDGGRNDLYTPLVGVSRDAQGEVESWRAVTWTHDRQGDVLWPLAWNRAGHRGVLPLYADGPGYRVSPALLSGSWDNAAGGSTTWLTPLFHRSTRADGGTSSMHLLTWYHEDELDIVLPFGWMQGRPGHRTGALLPFYAQGENWRAVLPLWFQGRNGWLMPPLLSGERRFADGGHARLITPLYHDSASGDGTRTSRHIGPWFDGGDERGSYRGVLPLWYDFERDGQAWNGVVPLWFSGPGWQVAPPALSAHWRNAAGGTTTWLTPFYHRSTDFFGATTSRHAGPWWQRSWSRDGDSSAWNGVFPLWWRHDAVRDGVPSSSTALLPLWMRGDDWWAVPPLLSLWQRGDDGATDLWVTPLFHRRADASGRTERMHAGLWYQEGDRRMLMPFYYQSPERLGLIPLWFSGPDGWIVPPALSWRTRRADGSTSTWLTPLFHADRDAEGRLTSRHVLNWVQGRDGQALLPLWYDVNGYQGIVPLAFSGPDWWTVPAALSGGWTRRDGGKSLWVTPLFHTDRDAQGRLESWHALNWVQGRDSRALWPIFGAGRDWWSVPLALSGSWRTAEGGRETWLTPLAHLSRDAQGRATAWHALNVVHGPQFDAVLPLFWKGPDWTVAAPFYAAGRDWWTVPLALAAGWRDEAGSTAITPLSWHRRRTDGSVTTAIPPLLFAYRGGRPLDTGLPTQLWPFLVQNGTDGSEVNLLWRLYHQRELGGTRQYTVGPLWWSEHRAGEPTDWQVLGGLFGRDVDRQRRTSLPYALWGALRFGRTPYPPETSP